MIAVLLILLLATPALAQQQQQQYDEVDIQLLVTVGPLRDETGDGVPDPFVANCTPGVEQGQVAKPGYQNCSDRVPYSPSGHWLCVTRVTCHIYTASRGSDNVFDGRVLVTWLHDHAGHSYHQFKCPPQFPMQLPPTAFPPDEPILFRVRNNTGEPVFILSHLGGYLGAPAGPSVARYNACK